MRWGFVPFRRYFEFSGRSRRKEYWWFTLFVSPLIFVSLLVATGMISFGRNGPGSQGLFALIGLILMLPPSLALHIRRLHDIDHSAWWALLNFVPFGSLLLFYFHLLPGTRGPNRFGPDPTQQLGNLREVFA